MVQRLEKVLQGAGIILTSVASTVLSKSARAMLEAMLAGESDPVVLAELAKGMMRPKILALTDALRGSFWVAHHGVLVAPILAHVDFLAAQLANLDAESPRGCRPSSRSTNGCRRSRGWPANVRSA